MGGLHRESFSVLSKITDKQKIKTFCYPYGGFHSFTKVTEDILEKNDVDFSFNVEPRDIPRHGCNLNLQALPRFDCNFFPHGKSENNKKEG